MAVSIFVPLTKREGLRNEMPRSLSPPRRPLRAK